MKPPERTVLAQQVLGLAFGYSSTQSFIHSVNSGNMILPLIRLGPSLLLPAGEVIGPFTIKIKFPPFDFSGFLTNQFTPIPSPPHSNELSLF
jgi:hypothetical protein